MGVTGRENHSSRCPLGPPQRDKARGCDSELLLVSVGAQVPDQFKTNCGKEAFNPTGIVPRAVTMIKDKFPDAMVRAVGGGGGGVGADDDQGHDDHRDNADVEHHHDGAGHMMMIRMMMMMMTPPLSLP
jgi:hypothetical protein